LLSYTGALLNSLISFQNDVEKLNERNAYLTKYEDEADEEIYRMADVIEGLRNDKMKLMSQVEELTQANSAQQVGFR